MRHELANAAAASAGTKTRPPCQPMQMPLPGVERNADRMIEMRVRDEDVRHGRRRVGTASDVEGAMPSSRMRKNVSCPARDRPSMREVRRVDGDRSRGRSRAQCRVRGR